MKKLIFITIFSCLWCLIQAQNNPIIKVKQGKIEGYSNGGILIFKGIPYAAPPVGALRWKAPAALQSWKGIKSCKVFGTNAMQNPPKPFMGYTEEFLIPNGESFNEDCLYLNVWTKNDKKTAKKGVLVWIHGGAFLGGSGSVPIYDGEAMAKKGIVFVSINYRVNIFGFMAHPELSKENPQNASGNYGLLDQIAALKWVKQNIKKFGGDPENITIAGQSAGSMSVNCLVASPLAKGLFQKAIAESGACFTKGNILIKTPSLKDEEARGVEFMKKCQANSIAELRNKSAEEVFKNLTGFIGPVIDGYVLPDAIATIFAKNQENKVILMTGWNENEGGMNSPIKKTEEYKAQVVKQFGDNADKVLQAYKGQTLEEAQTSSLNLNRDLTFGLQNYVWANVHSQKGNTVYLYRFAHALRPKGDALYGAFHTAEVPFAYNNLKFVNRDWQAEDWKLAEDMSSYWVNFIKTGNPNGDKLPNWTKYNATEKQVMYFNKTPNISALSDSKSLDILFEIMKY